MKVTHGINLHNIDECRHHKQVREEANHIASEVSNEVYRPQDNRDQKDSTHDYA